MTTLTAIEEVRLDVDEYREIEHEFYAWPCPFCGSECVEFVDVDLSPFQNWKRVACVDCDALGPSAELYQAAVDKWNAAKR